MTDEKLRSYEAHKKASAQYMKELAAENAKSEKTANVALIISVITIVISVITIISKLL